MLNYVKRQGDDDSPWWALATSFHGARAEFDFNGMLMRLLATTDPVYPASAAARRGYRQVGRLRLILPSPSRRTSWRGKPSANLMIPTNPKWTDFSPRPVRPDSYP